MTGDSGSHRLPDRLGVLLARRFQLLRYAGVSVIATLTSLTVLGVLVGALGVGAVVANLAATAIGTVPSYELNRRWVWRAETQRSIGREVVPFCALSFAGLLVSTLTVHIASSLSSRSGQLIHTGAVEFANVAAYGSLWVVQFLLLDRVLFGPRSDGKLSAGHGGLSPDGVGMTELATASPHRPRQSTMPPEGSPRRVYLPGSHSRPSPAGRAPGPGAGPPGPVPAGSMPGPHSPRSNHRLRRA